MQYSMWKRFGGIKIWQIATDKTHNQEYLANLMEGSYSIVSPYVVIKFYPIMHHLPNSYYISPIIFHIYVFYSAYPIILVTLSGLSIISEGSATPLKSCTGSQKSLRNLKI